VRRTHPVDTALGTPWSANSSAQDLTLIARIAALAAVGVNIAGITRILDLEDANTALRTAGSSRG